MKRSHLMLGVVPWLLLAACARHHPAGPGAGAVAPALTDAATNNPAASDRTPSFVLGQGDKITVNVWRNDEFGRSSVQVDVDGLVTLPVLGTVRAEGLTVEELTRTITDRLTQYVVDPRVDISLVSIASRKVLVLGEVMSPGSVSLDRDISVWECITLAGGFSTDANTKRVLLARAAASNQVTVSVLNLDMKRSLKKGRLEQTGFLMRHGDILYAPPQKIADVERFMNRLNNILNPLIGIEKAIVLEPSMIDALEGKTTDTQVVQ